MGRALECWRVRVKLYLSRHLLVFQLYYKLTVSRSVIDIVVYTIYGFSYPGADQV